MMQIIPEKITPEQFVYWLQGFVEISGETPTEAQWKAIKDHLAEVFRKVTPDYGTLTTTTWPRTDKDVMPLTFKPETGDFPTHTFIC